MRSNVAESGGGPPEKASPGVALVRLLLSLAIPLTTIVILAGGFVFLRDSGASQLVITAVAVFWGIAGVVGLYWTAYWFVQRIPSKWRPRVEPYLFIGPAVIGLAWFIAIPVFRTGYFSLFDRYSENWAGWSNFVYIFTDRKMLTAWTNNVIWLVVGTSLSVLFGFIIAFVADRTKWEAAAKSMIFMPMAISMVGASIIWKFVYAIDPDIGLLNAIVTAFGGTPQNWLIARPWNTLFLIVVFIWGQTGFAMIVLSTAIKGVPVQLIEAAKIDGANNWRQVINIVIPYIKSTILTVSTAIVIASLKTFDIVYTMTNGLDGTEVLASQQYKQMFRYFNYGRGAAIALIILLAVIPVVIYNVMQYRKSGNL